MSPKLCCRVQPLHLTTQLVIRAVAEQRVYTTRLDRCCAVYYGLSLAVCSAAVPLTRLPTRDVRYQKQLYKHSSKSRTVDRSVIAVRFLRFAFWRY